MTKYFIENDKGEWMTPIGEHPGVWTRDPFKAWAFDRAPGISEEDKNRGFFIIDTREMAGPVMDWMSSEGILGDAHVTQQEFFQVDFCLFHRCLTLFEEPI